MKGKSLEAKVRLEGHILMKNGYFLMKNAENMIFNEIYHK